MRQNIINDEKFMNPCFEIQGAVPTVVVFILEICNMPSQSNFLTAADSP